MSYKIAVNTIALDRKIPQGDPLWGRFNDSFVNRQLDVLDFANEIYTGHAFAGWHTGRRKLDNFECAQVLAVDMDTGDERSSFGTLEQHELVALYAGMMYTTPSHRDDAPRTRVLFFLDTPISGTENYNAAARFLIAQFEGADPSCNDASRFFYGNKNCHIWLSDNHVLPLCHLRWYYKRWQAKQPKVKRTAQPQAQPRARQDTPTELREVEEALKRINPWSIDYRQWIAILAALHDEYGDHALPLAVQWGQGVDGEIEKKWRSFGRYAGTPARLGTIFELAKSH